MCCVCSLTCFDSPIRCLSFSPDGTYLAAAAENSTLVVCSTKTGTVVNSIDCKQPINAVSWHPYKNMVVVAIDDRGQASGGDDRYHKKQPVYLKSISY